MCKQMLNLETKIDELAARNHAESIDKMDDVLMRMEDSSKEVDNKINDVGLKIASVARKQERQTEIHRREEETVRKIDNRLDSYDAVLRRILAFHLDLVAITDHQEQTTRRVQELLDLAALATAGEATDDDDRSTQYDNNNYQNETLGTGPSPTIFPLPSRNPTGPPPVT